ncbi:mitochondrial amidoxime-reducing component 1-like [Glandiceps talaboti]
MADTIKPVVVIGVVVCATIVAAIWMFKSTKKKRNYKAVGTLKSIYIHPVKSCRAIELEQGDCGKRGLMYGVLKDRHWMILNEDNRFRTISHEPSMVLIAPSLSENGDFLLLDAPNMSTLQIPIDISQIPENEQEIIHTRLWRQDVAGKYCGKDAEVWLTKYFGKPMKLIYGDDDIVPREVDKAGRPRKLGKKDDYMIYQEDAGYMLLSDSSLQDLSGRMDSPITAKHFRPNFVVAGSIPYDEDNWKFIKIGNVVLRHVKYDERCKVTTVDPETGLVSDHNEPIKTLKTYRMCKKEDKEMYYDCPLFGVHLGIDQEGRLELGDTIFAAYQ